MKKKEWDYKVLKFLEDIEGNLLDEEDVQDLARALLITYKNIEKEKKSWVEINYMQTEWNGLSYRG